MFTVVARYYAKPETADEVASLLPKLAEASRTEEGNVSYVVNRDLETPENFVIVEVYGTADDFQAHRDSEHFQEIGFGKIIPLLRERTVATFESDEA